MGYIQEIRKKVGHDEVLLAAAGVFLYQDGKILLQKRKDNHCWSLHGGCVELGEETMETARRELKEETGLTAGHLELFGVFSGEDMRYTYPNGDRTSIIEILYLCTDFSGEMLPETDETSELRWFDVDQLPDNISPPDRRPLRTFAQWAKRQRGE